MVEPADDAFAWCVTMVAPLSVVVLRWKSGFMWQLA
jgi:hypothetical protein